MIMGLLDLLKKIREVKDDRGIRTKTEKLEGKTIILLLKESYKTRAAYDKRKTSYCVIYKDPETNEKYFFETAGKALKYQMRKLLETNLEEVPLKMVRRRSQKGYYCMLVAVDKTLPQKLSINFR